MSNESIRALFSDAITRRVLKKAVFSKAADKAVAVSADDFDDED